jgi:hypothetical protein
MKISSLAILASLPLLILASSQRSSAQAAPAGNSVKDYASIQEAIDKNPGKVLYVPPGDYEISDALSITKDNSGLTGPGRIIETNPLKTILHIEGAKNVQLRDLTFTRPDGKTDTLEAGVSANNSPNLTLDNVQIIGNRTRFAALLIVQCNGARVRNCSIENYMRIAEEDRVHKVGQGYAFMTINGTGIDIRASVGALLQGTRVIEHTYLPTPELKEKYGLGKFTKRGVRGVLVSKEMWDSGYYNAWHQGAAIHLGVPDVGDYIQVLGNYIENAAQGIDVQGDHVIIANNIVNNAFIGMKAVLGTRNVIITGNQFSKNDLWAIALTPGIMSHAASMSGTDGKPVAANIDGYSIVSNNIISDFGFGTAAWMWKDSRRYAIRFDEGPVPGLPPETDVLVQGNIVYDTGRDKVLVDGKPQVVPPGYEYAVYLSQKPGGPQGFHFANNLLNPGTSGTSNVVLPP